VTPSRDPLQIAEAAGAWIRFHGRTAREGLTWPRVPAEGEAAVLNLYSGTPGVILFLLELYHATGDPRYLEEARAGAFLLQAAFLESGDWPLAAGSGPEDPTLRDPGLYTGRAGVAFVLAEVDRANGGGMAESGPPLLFDSIVNAAKPVGSGVAWFGDDPATASYDIISGSAGIGLTLLHAQETFDFPRGLETAVDAGRYLLEVGRPAEGGLKWPISESVPSLYPNFSHGTAGVGYFLARLTEVTGDEVFLDGALQGARYLKAVATCRDNGCLIFHHEPDGLDLFYLGWCHGPPGTARFFRQLAKVTGEAEWEDWVDRGVRALELQGIPETRTEGYWNNVSQCCGDAGVGDFLLSLARETGNQEYVSFARRFADHITGEGSEDDAGFRWNQAEHRSMPELIQAQTGWMQGAAGVGAFFLHLDGTGKGRLPRVRFPDAPG
jgi:lantibiotic modifying enzyme